MSGSQQFKMMKNVTESLAERSRDIVEISYDQVWQTIQRGSMPELVINKDFDWQMFYGPMLKHIWHAMLALVHQQQSTGFQFW